WRCRPSAATSTWPRSSSCRWRMTTGGATTFRLYSCASSGGTQDPAALWPRFFRGLNKPPEGSAMAKLILSMDGLVLKEIPLTKERTTIGRKPHNDIQIDNLAVSGEHAVIVTILNDSFLEDLGSTNGTVVNGNAIKKHFLQNNDVIELGKYK